MKDWIGIAIVCLAIISGCALNAAAINGEWWIDPVQECSVEDLIA